MNFFDVAFFYGPAEQVLGRALAPFRQTVWLTTKVGWGPQGKLDCSPEHILSSCEQSLKHLQTEWSPEGQPKTRFRILARTSPW